MNHYEANRILDRVREGPQQFSHFVITRVIELTGDYETNGSNGMDQALPQESARGRRGEAHWWQQTLADIAKKRGQAAADDLRQRMNEQKGQEIDVVRIRRFR